MNGIRIGVAQIPQTADIQKNCDKAIEYMEKAKSEGVELLCFPETHLAGYRVGILGPDAPCDSAGLSGAIERIKAQCKSLSIGVIVGTETPNRSGKPYNSAVVIDQEGKIVTVHHKFKLTPGDAQGYAPGTGPTMFHINGIPMGIVICFDGYRFPETVRELAHKGAKVVWHPQFNHVSESMMWKKPILEALIMARAGENTLYFISANMCHRWNNCRSLVVSPDGLIQEASVLGQEMLLVADLDTDLATHAFLHDDSQARAKALGEL